MFLEDLPECILVLGSIRLFLGTESDLECKVGLESSWTLNRVTGRKQEMIGVAETVKTAKVELINLRII